MSEAPVSGALREGTCAGARARAAASVLDACRHRGREARGARHRRRACSTCRDSGRCCTRRDVLDARECVGRVPARGAATSARARRSRTRWAARRFGTSRCRWTSACSFRGRRPRCSWTRSSTRERTGLAIDIGTGSGAIALALASEGQFERVIGTDVSSGAVAVARANGERLAAVLHGAGRVARGRAAGARGRASARG